MTPSNPDAPRIMAFPPLLFLTVLLCGIGAHLVCPMALGLAFPLRVAAMVIGIASGLLAWSARREMLRAGTHINPRLPTTAIVTGGPFRFTRNPLYLSLCLLNLAVGLALSDATPVLLTVVLAALFNWGVIAREEKYLEAKFGEPYLAYRRRVPRWL